MADPLLRAIEANKSKVMAVCGHKVAVFKNVEKAGCQISIKQSK